MEIRLEPSMSFSGYIKLPSKMFKFLVRNNLEFENLISIMETPELKKELPHDIQVEYEKIREEARLKYDEALLKIVETAKMCVYEKEELITEILKSSFVE